MSFAQIVALPNLLAAWLEFKQGKAGRLDVLAFEQQLEDNLVTLQQELGSGSYRHGPYERFVVYDPKRREISKATVRDRLVHHALVRALEPAFERQFIFDSWACRCGKGTHAAVARFQKLAWRVSRNNTRTVWVLKLDVRRFFASIDHAVVRQVLWRTISDERTRGLVNQILESFVPGLPLGNVTSQLFGNVLLNEVDHWIKDGLHVPYYLRYCDDLIFWHADRQFLVALLPVVRSYLAGVLKLELHPRKVLLRRYHAGLDVLGYVCFPHYRLLRPTTVRRVLARYDARTAPSYDGLLSHCCSCKVHCRLHVEPAGVSTAKIAR